MYNRTADERRYGGCYVWVRIILNIAKALGSERETRDVVRDTAIDTAGDSWNEAVNEAVRQASDNGWRNFYDQARSDCAQLGSDAKVDIGGLGILADIAGVQSVRHRVKESALSPVRVYLGRLAILTSFNAPSHDGHQPCANLSCAPCYHEAVRRTAANGSENGDRRIADYVGFIPALAIRMMVDDAIKTA